MPGHEVVGEIVQVGKDVKEFVVGDLCVADNSDSVCIAFAVIILFAVLPRAHHTLVQCLFLLSPRARSTLRELRE